MVVRRGGDGGFDEWGGRSIVKSSRIDDNDVDRCIINQTEDKDVHDCNMYFFINISESLLLEPQMLPNAKKGAYLAKRGTE